MEVMDAMLEALSRAEDSDEALHPFRCALFFEDASAETLHVALQVLNLHEVGVCRQSRIHINANHLILLPDYALTQGATRESAGFSFDNEYEAQRVQVPAFEIDAAPVTWAQYADFITDGGYDELSHWSREGLVWLTHAQRRVPLHVEQAGAQVIVNRFARVLRVDLREPVRHVTLWEAQAYAHWAGRRLPTEVEWLRATSSQQFTWGALHEWTASRYRDFAGYRDVSAERYGLPRHLPAGAQTLCGASFATSPRLRDARMRYAFAPEAAQEFVGFRTCAL
jgi:formylglycine-generating enzyme required for sulfatase activity